MEGSSCRTRLRVNDHLPQPVGVSGEKTENKTLSRLGGRQLHGENTEIQSWILAEVHSEGEKQPGEDDKIIVVALDKCNCVTVLKECNSALTHVNLSWLVSGHSARL